LEDFGRDEKIADAALLISTLVSQYEKVEIALQLEMRKYVECGVRSARCGSE